MKWNEGEFCWTELATLDAGAAKEFYANLFQWEFESIPIPEGGEYVMANVQGKPALGMYQISEEQKKMGVPPHFGSYLMTESADQLAKRTKELGGKVLKEPFDVMNMGRMAVMQDPSDAVFYCWQPKENERQTPPQFAHGKVGWRELMTTDVEGSGKFYCELAGWNVDAKDMGEFVYHQFKRGDDSEAGMMAIPKEWGPVPSHWMVYFNVDNCDQTVEKAKKAGAKVYVEPQDIPETGRFSVLNAPDGAGFAVIEFQR